VEEAVACYRRGVLLEPDNAAFHSNLLRALLHDPATELAAVRNEHLAWADRHARPLAGEVRPHANDRNPNRRLRIGYVSPDLRAHAIGWLMGTILEHHDRQGFEIVCYSDAARICRPDAQTQRLQRHAHLWRDSAPLDDQQLADLIRQDRIDILVDLATHSANNRLLVFARKPAPVQVTYLGYPGPTGLSTMDYRLTDCHLNPPGQEPEGPEKLVYLPDCYWCYSAPADAPDVNDLPAAAKGHISFACLNTFGKVNSTVLALWAKVLAAVPRSRLHLLIAGGRGNGRVYKIFEQSGIDPQRIELIDRQDSSGYFKLYHAVDIALDPFPYNGHTTSYDGLYMGVPLVTLAGQLAVGRAGVSILSNVGLTDLIAQTSEQYVEIAASLAGNLPRVAELRRTLRQRMQDSPLMDGPRFVRNLELAYRQMWRAWCG
jgi:predicted O-linked N-acetylglucosamine transferase (SPINDLY family)